MTKKLFTIKDAWPWVAITVFPFHILVLVAFSKAAKAEHHAISALAVAAVLAAVVIRFRNRWKDVDKWNKAPKLWLDVAVLSPITAEQLSAVEDAPLVAACSVIGFEVARGVDDAWGKIKAAISGCDVTFMPARWEEGGLTVVGVQDGDHIRVLGQEASGAEQTRLLIIHELAHRALTAIGVPPGPNGENHHRIFEQERLGC